VFYYNPVFNCKFSQLVVVTLGTDIDLMNFEFDAQYYLNQVRTMNVACKKMGGIEDIDNELLIDPNKCL